MTESLYPRHGNSGPAPEVTPPSVLARHPSGARWLYRAVMLRLPGFLREMRTVTIFEGWVGGSILAAIEEQAPDALEPS